MKWLKFKIKTITAAEDIIISTLYDLGLEGAQIEDKIPLTAWEKEQMFVDILPDGPEDDGVAYLSFFVEEKDEKAEESKYPVIVLNEEETTAEAVLAMVQQELDELKEFNLDIGKAQSLLKKRRISTGSTTGSSIFISSRLTMYWLFLPGKRCRRRIRTR